MSQASGLATIAIAGIVMTATMLNSRAKDDAKQAGAATNAPPAKASADCYETMKSRTKDDVIQWQPPRAFARGAADLGMPKLAAAEHTAIYDPKPCKGDADRGGNGKYESLEHGTYNHGPKIRFYEDKLIVCWGNHSRDEYAAGARILAKVGAFTNAARAKVRWGGAETMAEILPPAAPVRNRTWSYDSNVVNAVSVNGGLSVVNGRLYVNGSLHADHGFSSDMSDHLAGTGKPIPAEKWRDALDEGETATERRNSKGGPWCDVYWSLGAEYIQRWKLDAQRQTLVPDSPMFRRGEPLTQLEVNPGRIKKITPLLEPYASARPYAEAPEDFKQDWEKGQRTQFDRFPKYASAQARIAATDGNNGLAHGTEFKRPDGKWVAVRDNLKYMGVYYAALKDKPDDTYPPGRRSNLWGSAMPAAGELPDGRPWILCNVKKRTCMFLVLSDDGITFDKTWLVYQADLPPEPGSIGKSGGPQYFHALTEGGNIWVAYSIGKIKIGVTRIPIPELVKAAADYRR
jgi:hypothetical protein